MTIPITKPYFDGNEYNYIKRNAKFRMGRSARKDDRKI